MPLLLSGLHRTGAARNSGGRSVKQSRIAWRAAKLSHSVLRPNRRGNVVAKGTQAVAYLRMSSAANVGADKDSDKRQRDATVAFAKRSGFVVVDEFYDPAVSGADPIETRPGFATLLDRIESNGVRTVIVEDASRFARDLV